MEGVDVSGEAAIPACEGRARRENVGGGGGGEARGSSGIARGDIGESSVQLGPERMLAKGGVKGVL